MDGLILAIDLGKFNSVCCWYDARTKSATYRQAKTTKGNLGRDLTRHRVECVVIEAGSPAGWVHDLCVELGLPCRVANTAGPAWQGKSLKRKTDRDDALSPPRMPTVWDLIPKAPRGRRPRPRRLDEPPGPPART